MKWPHIASFAKGPTTAGIVTLSAPEAARNPENVRRGIEWLEHHQVRHKWAKHALNDSGFLADSPQALADDLHELLMDPEVDWILTTGGGANANSLLPWLRPDVLKNHPKPVIGLSNTTVVLNALAMASGVITFHGPVLVWNLGNENGLDQYTEDHLVRAFRSQSPLVIGAESTWHWLRPGSCQGRVWGGNLWSFQQLIGTPYMPDLAGAVLAIEECFTELHNLEAMLYHLRTAKLLDNLAGMIVGLPLECRETEHPDGRDFEKVVADACSDFRFPILAGVSLGHTDRKITTPLGAMAHLSSEANKLTFAS